jgi:short-subunit dehydrogenase involved in D-alanine esterification of teichoic acids
VKTPDRVVVIGGGSGMGLEVAKKVLAAGGEVVIAGRSQDRLHAARIRPGGSITFTSGIAARRPMRGGSAATGTVLDVDGGHRLV